MLHETVGKCGWSRRGPCSQGALTHAVQYKDSPSLGGDRVNWAPTSVGPRPTPMILETTLLVKHLLYASLYARWGAQCFVYSEAVYTYWLYKCLYMIESLPLHMHQYQAFSRSFPEVPESLKKEGGWYRYSKWPYFPDVSLLSASLLWKWWSLYHWGGSAGWCSDVPFLPKSISNLFGFSSSHVWMWELDYEESWTPKNWCFWTVVLEKTLESPLDCKEIQPIHPKGKQSWLFIGRTDVEAETLILWLPDVKNRLIWKDPDAWKDWRQEEKGTTEDEMVGWHHWLEGQEFE